MSKLSKIIGLWIFLLFKIGISYGQIEIKDSSFFGFEEKRYALLKKSATNEQNFGYDWIYSQIELSINPESPMIQGKVAYWIESEVDTLGEFVVQAHPNLQILSATQNGVALSISINDFVRTIRLDKKVLKGERTVVSLVYSGVPPQDILGYRQEQHASGYAVWTLSEPYGLKNWIPCKESLRDKLDSVSISVTVPKGYEVATNGLLIKKDTIDSALTTFYWKHNYPMAYYLLSVAVSNYEVFTEYYPKQNKMDSFAIVNYAYPHSAEKWKEEYKYTPMIMNTLTEHFGAYPFEKEKYGHAEFSFGGGMEHQTISSMRHLGFLLTAHELAHQWFGNKITCGTWEDIWLNEGFATYCEGLSLEAHYPELEVINWRKRLMQNVLSDNYGAISVNDTTQVGRIFSARLSYHKAGLMLYMLREYIGKDAFSKAVGDYITSGDYGYKNAVTADFIKFFSSTTAQNFLRKWIYQEGFPIISIYYDYDNKAKKLIIQAFQKSSTGKEEYFPIQIPVKIVTNTGNKEYSFILNEPSSVFEVSMENAPDSLSVNEKYQAVAKFNVYPFSTNSDKFLVLHLKDNQLQIESKNLSMQGAYHARIISRSGKVVYNGELSLFQKAMIDLQGISKGLYLLELENENQRFFKKFVYSHE